MIKRVLLGFVAFALAGTFMLVGATPAGAVMGVTLAQVVHQLISVDVRHSDVRNDDVGRDCLDVLQRPRG